jgi:hypothetical protein
LGPRLFARAASELISHTSVCGLHCSNPHTEILMGGLIYLVGLVVVVMAILSFLGMH